ncbi:MAG: hypothetical protein ACJ0OX_01315 [Candidatus Marisimplicoccus sp.]|nr:hypothetical protein [Flavobacteriaceae bacterium]MBT4324310.1 hypothetical protein [Cryomorphaceae bacterium]MBT7739186.1 hypothetical protein [Cryomorphaceae bacterium]RZP00558.1 MAG: hypothetical protein EVA40_01750 [Flavobacteriales bacterium]
MFKLNKNRRFNYTPRFFKGKEDVSTNFESKFSKYRDSYNSIDMGMNWSDQRDKMRNTRNRGINLTLILIVVFLILVFLFIIDFDLTIFYTN